MDSLKSALENVAADKGRICGSLYYIRSNVTNKLEGINELYDRGGIKILVKCLKQLNPKVLSLTLSILGNCSMTEACREQLFNYGVIKDLSIILKNICVDSIVNRSCRMIANLAESQAYIEVMYKHNILSILVNVLSNTKCNLTKYSAIRALRKIWEKSSKSGCAVMLKLQAVEVVSGLLKSKCNEIVVAVLRAQASFLSNPCNSKHPTNNALIVLQILGKAPESVNTVNTFMDLLPEQELVAKVIFSLCKKLPYAKEHLFQSKLIVRIIDVLKNQNNDYLKRSLCLLLECPLSRHRFIDSESGISIILNIISGTNTSQKELAINALLKFQHSKNSLKTMAKQGLIPILIKNLSSYIETHKIPHLCRIKMEPKPLDTTSLFVSCASPSGSSSMSPSSPVRVSWTPPKEDRLNKIPNYCPSPNYSPVCESFDSESINGDESKSDTSEYDLVIEDDEMPSPEKPALEGNILQLLLYLSYIENVVNTMAVKDVWETLLDCILYINHASINIHAVKILEMITREVLNFNTIISDGFILSTHQKMCRPIHELELCTCCSLRNDIGMDIIKNAISTFESQFADSVMISIMNEPGTSATNESLKKVVSVTIPLVIQCKPNQLIAMLSRYKVFDNLCNIIKDGENELFDDAVGALMALFKTSNITYPKSSGKSCQTRNCHKKILKKETTVTLALDDGTLISANKSFLSLKSPMFEAMFRCGGFKEAYQNTIRLNDVSSECLKSFMNLLDEYCDCLLPRDISVLLELIMITDKYMLNELSEKIGMVVLNTMSIDIAWYVYEWTKVTGYQLKLGSDTGLDVVKYLFSSNSRFPDRVDTIKKISISVHSKNFIEDLSTLLKNGLTSICGDKISEFYLSKYFAGDLD